jgi:hypothetical protein
MSHELVGDTWGYQAMKTGNFPANRVKIKQQPNMVTIWGQSSQ